MIEDNAEHAQLLEQLLSASAQPRFWVQRAGSVADGLKRLRASKFDVMLLDLSLPDSQGLSTFDAVFAAAGSTPIVILSGVSDVSVAIQALQRGAQDYLVKGHVDNQLLLRSIQYAVERCNAQAALKEAHDELESRVRARTSEQSQLNERLKREILDRKRAEDAMKESNQQLLAALAELRAMQGDLIRRERFQALAQMANGIAHEFNNVLAPIVGFTEHLLTHPSVVQGPDLVRSSLEKIRTAALAGSKAVMRVRDFARTEAGEFGPVPVAELVANIIILTEPRWKDEAQAAGVTISILPAVQDVPDAHGDAAQLREMLTHLVFNATSALSERGVIQIGAERRGGGVALYVQDDGRGMPESVRKQCLDPKANVGVHDKRMSGYAVVHSIVARHHGRLEIETQEGAGTKVSVVLPAVPQNIVEFRKPVLNAEARLRKLRVLVVDDEPMVRDVIRLYLGEDGHVVETATDGKDALEKFMAGQFDMVMTDRAMPEMSGDQLAGKVKALNPLVPVILLTGFGDLMNAEGEKPQGVDAVAAKPFTLQSLRNTIAEVCGTPEIDAGI
jgi:DNA-binding response OmpR family regulator